MASKRHSFKAVLSNAFFVDWVVCPLMLYSHPNLYVINDLRTFLVHETMSPLLGQNFDEKVMKPSRSSRKPDSKFFKSAMVAKGKHGIVEHAGVFCSGTLLLVELLPSTRMFTAISDNTFKIFN